MPVSGKHKLPIASVGHKLASAYASRSRFVFGTHIRIDIGNGEEEDDEEGIAHLKGSRSVEKEEHDIFRHSGRGNAFLLGTWLRGTLRRTRKQAGRQSTALTEASS